jgi:hypothetical protein
MLTVLLLLLLLLPLLLALLMVWCTAVLGSDPAKSSLRGAGFEHIFKG